MQLAIAHRPRVLSLDSPQAAVAEMRKLGVQAPADAWMADKAQVRAIRLENVPGRAANLLKQECLAVGIDCAVSPQVCRFDDTPRPVIVIGDLRRLKRLVDRLAMQPFGLPEIGREIAFALEAYEAGRRPKWICRGRQVPTDRRTVVMGIINVTPDSFSGDGLAGHVDLAVERAVAMAQAGADIIDVGGESTRPGSDPVPVEEELRRVIPVIRELAGRVDALISVDTQKPEVAKGALEAGAHIVNDVFGLRAPGMIETVAEFGAGAVIMHMLGTPKTMQQSPRYEDLMTEIYDFLCRQIEAAVEGGVAYEAIAIDPGFGFGKTVQHNLEMLRRLRELTSLGRPVLIGTSRKSTIGHVLGREVSQRLWGTAATCAVAIANGAHIIRVHDVAEMADVAKMTDAIMQGWQEGESSGNAKQPSVA